MAIKLKNNRLLRIIIAAVVIAAVVFVNILFFPAINKDVEKQISEKQEHSGEEYSVNDDILHVLYEGCYVLYYEHIKQEQGANLEPEDLYIAQESLSGGEDLFNSYFSEIEQQFEEYRYNLDYYAVGENQVSEKSTEKQIEAVLEDEPDAGTLEYLQKTYEYCLIFEFDEKGIMSFQTEWSGDIEADLLLKSVQKIERESNLPEMMREYIGLEHIDIVPVQNFTVVYGILSDSEQNLLHNIVEDNSGIRYSYTYDASFWLYAVSLMVLFILSFLMSSRKLWADIKDYNRRGKWYIFEAAFVGVCVLLCFWQTLGDNICVYAEAGLTNIRDMYLHGIREQWQYFWSIICNLGLIYLTSYLTLLAVRPVFSLGIREYIRQYSFFYQIFPWMKGIWQKFKNEVNHIDFEEKSTKTILKIVIVNFVILAILMCMWMFGLFGLIVYSLVLFYLLRKYYDKIAGDYRTLMNVTSRIANGDLNTVIVEDIGVFEPFKQELFKIRTGFKKAVDEETKSQRMKSELITNVSHDLKTPLTAITTYVELLKKEDITEEERRPYVETLDKKSQRLKVLIEDLFEVSKASSNNITLNLMDVDVVKLMKQVTIEHTDQYEAMGIELRWKVPKEKVILKLDNQKTYRIFENLFVNIQKYAMPNSRVYIDVEKTDTLLQITIKNMSAVALNIRPEELTERFVRGDASRNTEGSGLGLAIAKSFTEAQKGTFVISVDGDLFKTELSWKF